MRLYTKTALWFFFRKWQVHRAATIPKNASIIFVANHQNAFQDAILVACSTLHKQWFLTRAGVFNNKFVRAILHSFHMMPVYRFRDGVKGLRNNDATIQQSIDLLKDRKSILVFGEGDQDMRYRLRTMQKGFARIALAAQEESNWSLPLYIVPVGIQYDHYYNFRSRVLISYGEAISVDASLKSLPERELYETLLDKTRQGLLPHMVHITSDNYEEIENYLHANRNKEDLAEQLKYDQEIVRAWDGNPKKIPARPKNNLLLVAAMPLHIYVWINNFAPYFLIKWLLNKYVTREFRGSLKVGFAMVIVPLFYLVQTIAVHMVFVDWRITLAYVLTLPFLSIWSVDLFKSARGTLL
jgi:1-acyl-sn-glycerol-3-phosphate acyltransferase